MAQAPAPFFAAYTDIIRQAILTAKSLLIRNTSMIDNVKKSAALLDAVSTIPESLFRWEDSLEPALRKKLEYFDSVWAREEMDFRLMKIYKKHIN
ncbi:MAG: hypothetical protein EHM28_06865 [Spirochaetaceae bacterium]|nr:MAG: hypothetical protein EHM28_06865 [Spirochaetaceae bacterium]